MASFKFVIKFTCSLEILCKYNYLVVLQILLINKLIISMLICSFTETVEVISRVERNYNSATITSGKIFKELKIQLKDL